MKSRGALQQKGNDSQELLLKPSASMVNIKDSVSKFITNFQQVLDAPLSLQTYQSRNCVV